MHFKNSPEYITRVISRVFISLMRSLLQSLVSRNFIVLLRLFFSFISDRLIFLSTSNILKYLKFSFFSRKRTAKSGKY